MITVGALNPNTISNLTDDTIAPFSSRGPLDDGRIKPDLVAPGFNVITASKLGGYYQVNGTSFAAPHVSGASALLLKAHPELTALGVKSALITGADWQGPDGYFFAANSYEARKSESEQLHDWGFGRLNVEQSLEFVSDGDKLIQDVINSDGTVTKEYALSDQYGKHTKVFLTWFINPNGTIHNPVQSIKGDLTLELRFENGDPIIISNSTVQNTEFITFPVQRITDYKLIVTAEPNSSPPDTFITFVISSNKPITPSQGIECMPFDSTPYDWIIDNDCILDTDSKTNGNVIINNDSSLTIPNGLLLDVDFINKHVLIKDGGKLLIKNGGKID